jgi:hypothetical protein
MEMVWEIAYPSEKLGLSEGQSYEAPSPADKRPGIDKELCNKMVILTK